MGKERERKKTHLSGKFLPDTMLLVYIHYSTFRISEIGGVPYYIYY